MEHEQLEFFKLDVIDRKVLLWLMEHVPQRSVQAWIEYIAEDYKRRKAISIDEEKMFKEMIEN